MDGDGASSSDAGTASGGPSIIGATVVMRGDLSLEEDLIIEGTFAGSIRQGNQRLSIGEKARVTATIRTGSAVIAGMVDGNVEGTSTVVVRRTARLHGALSAKRLRLEPGANLEDVVLSGNVAFAEVADDRSG